MQATPPLTVHAEADGTCLFTRIDVVGRAFHEGELVFAVESQPAAGAEAMQGEDAGTRGLAAAVLPERVASLVKDFRFLPRCHLVPRSEDSIHDIVDDNHWQQFVVSAGSTLAGWRLELCDAYGLCTDHQPVEMRVSPRGRKRNMAAGQLFKSFSVTNGTGIVPAFAAPDKLGQYIFSLDRAGTRSLTDSHGRGGELCELHHSFELRTICSKPHRLVLVRPRAATAKTRHSMRLPASGQKPRRVSRFVVVEGSPPPPPSCASVLCAGAS